MVRHIDSTCLLCDLVNEVEVEVYAIRIPCTEEVTKAITPLGCSFATVDLVLHHDSGEGSLTADRC